MIFDDRMEEANKLFISEHKARNIARRMREEIEYGYTCMAGRHIADVPKPDS